MARPARESRQLVGAVSISHPDRQLFGPAGVTKLDLARYYERIADWILPHAEDRPLTLVRCPAGISGECFFMKHSKVWAPAPLRRVRIAEKNKTGEYLVADSIDAIIALVQMDVLEIHTWNSRSARVEQPDRIVIDLDPGREVAWPAVVRTAKIVRRLLHVLDLESFVKTTGGRGLHVVVPLTPRADWSECLTFARAFGEALVRQEPELYTVQFAKRGRDDKILIDYLRNNRTNTSITAFSTRAKPDAPVSVPLDWRELSAAHTPDRWTVASVPGRLARLRTDPWAQYWSARQTIPRRAIAALDHLSPEGR